MKHMMKKVLALVLGCALGLGVLAGCGSSFSADGLVKGNLDLIYLNQYTDEYLKSVDMTAEEADAEYEAGIDVEVEYFASYFDIVLDACDDTIETQLTEMYHRIYGHSKYEVGGVSKSGDTYLVQLTVYPIDIMQKVKDEDAESFITDWSARLENGEFDPEDPDYETKLETAWAQAIIDMMNARIDTIGYLEPQTISVQVNKNENDLYTIDDSDFSRIDSLIIQY